MALPNGDLITTVFDPQMAYPVDKRMQVDTLNSRDSISMFIRWEGMTVYVLEDSKIYILQGGRSNEFWKELGIGSGTGGTTFVGQFETADLLPTTGRAGDYAFVGTGDDFVQYNWDNISGQWVMAEGQTDMASDFFHIGYKTPIRRPVIFPLFPKDALVETSGDFVFAPETGVARFIFIGEVTAIRGIETAAADREIKLVNRTGSDIPLRDKASGIPAGSGMDFGGTDYVWTNGSEITLKGNGTYWELAPNNQIAFSDHLDSVNAQVSVGSDGLETISGILNKRTSKFLNIKEATNLMSGSAITDADVDNVIYFKIGAKYFINTDILESVVLNARDFGAVGDDSTDDTDALKAMILSGSKFVKPTLLIPNGYIFKTSSTITINYACNIIMDGQIKWYGGGDSICLDVYQSSGSMQYVNQSFNIVSNSVSNWLDENNIGVRLKALMFSNITIRNISGFTVGVRAFAPGNDGFAWNNIRVNEIFNCGIAIDLFGTSTGWVNENTWDLSGRIAANGTYNSRTRIDVRLGGSGTYHHNSNLFIKPAFESGSANYIPVKIDKGNMNTFENCRFESTNNGGLVAQISNDSDFNQISITNRSVSTPRFEDNSVRKNNYLFYRHFQANNNKDVIFDSGRLVEKTKVANGTRVNIKGVDCRAYTTTDVIAISPPTNGTRLRSDHIEITNGFEDIGVTVDTRNNREFIFQVNLVQGTTCNIGFIPFDSEGNVITSSGTVDGILNNNFYWASAANCWLIATATNGTPEKVLFSNDVVKARFVIRKASEETRISSFSIATVNKLPNSRTTSVYSEASSSEFNIANTIPVAGIGKEGDFVMNTNFPTSSYVFGWKCTASGSPGTWVEFGKDWALNKPLAGAVNADYVLSARDTWVNNFRNFTGLSGTVTIPPSVFQTNDEIVGVVTGGAKTFVADTGFTLKIPTNGSNVVGVNQRFFLKFLSSTEAILSIIKNPQTVVNASTTQRGIIEQATDAEVKTGTDTERAVDPKGLKDNYVSFTDRPITSTGTVAITPLTYNIKQEKITFTGTGTVTLNGFSDVISDRTLILINKTGNDLTIVDGASVTVPFSGAFVIPDNQSARFQVYSNLILKEL